MLHEIVRGWHGTTKIEAVELIAIDREPLKEPPALQAEVQQRRESAVGRMTLASERQKRWRSRQRRGV